VSAALHPQVEGIGRQFRVVGAATPSAFVRKAELLLTPNKPGERVAAVIGDAIRCSTTILSAFASGACAMTVTAKSGQGPTFDESRRIGDHLGMPVELAGELHGKPIDGGCMGNSPREADADKLAGRLIAFRSTNFGALFHAVTGWAMRFRAAGGVPIVAVVSFANAAATAQWVGEIGFDRVIVATGGFYDCISQEDVGLAGDVISALRLPAAELDDEARVMLDAARHRESIADRLDHFRTNWIGRCLANFGMAKDIPAVVNGEGIAPDVYAVMQRQLLAVNWVDGVAVIMPVAAVDHPYQPRKHGRSI
jgi:phosphosulfolactate phosphohydrolase-like enzyme